MATPLLDPHALKDVQVRDVVPSWDGDGVKAQDCVLLYARWERDVGVPLGEAKLMKTLLGAMLKDVAAPIEKRVICRNLSYAQIKEGVLREVNSRVIKNIPDHIFHGLTIPTNCSVGELSNFMEDFIYWGSQVREGVSFGHARQRSWTLWSTMTPSFIKVIMRRTSWEDLNSPTSPCTFSAKWNSDRKTPSSVITITRNGNRCP